MKINLFRFCMAIIPFCIVLYGLLEKYDSHDTSKAIIKPLDKIKAESYWDKRKSIDFCEKRQSWKEMIRKNKNKDLVMSSDEVLCAFEPLSPYNYKRERKTVVLGIGVHIGFALSGIFSAHGANIKYISWDHRRKSLGVVKDLLIAGYSKNHLLKTQRKIWDTFKHDTDLQRSDIIACGFDNWHCLIFAPFNKKLVFSDAYRFDGHISIDKQNMINLQNIFYNAVRYNPDVLIAPQIVYDVMYSQHFLGSHKIIPLPAACDYVKGKMLKESRIKGGSCRNVPKNATGYHPMSPIVIAISPARLSEGGVTVALQIMKYLKQYPSKYKIVVLKDHLKFPYRYCDLVQYGAFIVLGYSVMSYFTCEAASLGIPMFVPTPKLYGEWEKKYHLVQERKGHLAHTRYDYMIQNPRSINFGHNPNDDFNEYDLERWLSYSDYYYYKGAVQFSSFKDLHQKLQSNDLATMSKQMIAHSMKNNRRTKKHWKAIECYFYGNHRDDLLPQSSNQLPKSLADGYKIWREKVRRPNFNSSEKNLRGAGKMWLFINYSTYRNDFGEEVDCEGYTHTNIAFYGHGLIRSPIRNCIFYNLDNLKNQIPKKFAGIRWGDFRSYELLILLYATQNYASKIIMLDKLLGCKVDTTYHKIIHNSMKWRQRTFLPRYFYLAWLPMDNVVSKYWLETTRKLSEDVVNFPSICSIVPAISSNSYKGNDEFYLKDYMKYWKTD